MTALYPRQAGRRQGPLLRSITVELYRPLHGATRGTFKGTNWGEFEGTGTG